MKCLEVAIEKKRKRLHRRVVIKIYLVLTILLLTIVSISVLFNPTLHGLLLGTGKIVLTDRLGVYDFVTLLLVVVVWAIEHGVDILLLEDKYVPAWYKTPVTWSLILAATFVFSNDYTPIVAQVSVELANTAYQKPLTFFYIAAPTVCIILICIFSTRSKKFKYTMREIRVLESRIKLLRQQCTATKSELDSLHARGLTGNESAEAATLENSIACTMDESNSLEKRVDKLFKTLY